MVETTKTWPIGLRRLAEVIGPKHALLMAESYGGLAGVYIPIRARADHALAMLLGLDGMVRLCSFFGGQRLEIPRGVYRDLKKTQILDADGSNREIALRLNCTQRYVSRIKNEEKSLNQLSLFDRNSSSR